MTEYSFIKPLNGQGISVVTSMEDSKVKVFPGCDEDLAEGLVVFESAGDLRSFMVVLQRAYDEVFSV